MRSRGVPPALEQREIFYTEDVREAQSLLGQVFGPVRITPSPAATGPLGVTMNGVRLRDVSLLYVDLHVEADLGLAETGDYVLVLMPMNATATAVVNGQPAQANTTRSLVLNPGTRADIHLDHDAPLLVIRIEQEAVHRHLVRQLGRTLSHRLSFEPEFDLTTEPAMRWHGAVQLLHTEVFYEGSLTHAGRGIGALEDFLISCLLMVHTSTYTGVLSFPADKQQPGRRTVRRSIEYLEAHLSEPVTMAQLVEHVGASVRSIQQGFKEELSTTPMDYLRELRLERARQELLDAEPADGLTVTDVAEHWGFNHLSHFAALYKRRYGESPSDTLRRG